MAKYDPLREHLRSQPKTEIRMSFPEIEKVLGAKLPRSARTHPEWWANGVSLPLVQQKAWSDAGYSVASFDLTRETVIFVRK
jgi:hypothetical protein